MKGRRRPTDQVPVPATGEAVGVAVAVVVIVVVEAVAAALVQAKGVVTTSAMVRSLGMSTHKRPLPLISSHTDTMTNMTCRRDQQAVGRARQRSIGRRPALMATREVRLDKNKQSLHDGAVPGTAAATAALVVAMHDPLRNGKTTATAQTGCGPIRVGTRMNPPLTVTIRVPTSAAHNRLRLRAAVGTRRHDDPVTLAGLCSRIRMASQRPRTGRLYSQRHWVVREPR